MLVSIALNNSNRRWGSMASTESCQKHQRKWFKKIKVVNKKYPEVVKIKKVVNKKYPEVVQKNKLHLTKRPHKDIHHRVHVLGGQGGHHHLQNFPHHVERVVVFRRGGQIFEKK